MFFRKQPDIVAAVDLGSNSFHMIVARIQQGQLHVIDTLKEMVRLGSGVTPEHGIDAQTAARSLAALERFAERLGNLHPNHVRVVGTNALRRANRSEDFLQAAEQTLGYPIEVVSGTEEARLIYSGVSHCRAADHRRLLVIDIGGGSTELVVGCGREPERLESLHIGCLGLRQQFFEDGRLGAKRFGRAVLAGHQELQPIVQAYRRTGWDLAIGSSGTIRCIADNIAALNLTGGDITLPALYTLRDRLTGSPGIDAIDLPCVPAERAPVLPGGLAILIAAFEALDIERMQTSDCALREGILYELLGSQGGKDVRLQTLSILAKRYQIDMQHASRVEATCLRLYHQAAQPWGLDTPRLEQVLRWAAQLHEIGLSVSHSRYQLHGGYLIENSDMPGFSRREQTEMAALIRMHRRKLRPDYLEGVAENRRGRLLRLAALLRLAVVLHRSRDNRPAPEIALTVNDRALELTFPPGWLDRHPLTVADLEQEARYQQTAGLELNWR